MSDVAQYIGAERRRSTRISNGMKARLFSKDITGDVAVLNVSFHGALIQTQNIIEIGETLKLSMDIPTDSNSLDLTGRVVRMVTVCSSMGFCSFNIGIEFLDMLQNEKQKLSDTILYLAKKVKLGGTHGR